MRSVGLIALLLLFTACSQDESTELDPSAEAFLASLAESAATDEVAESPDPLDAMRSAMTGAIPLAGDPEPVSFVQNQTIQSEGGGLVLRTYRSSDATEKAILYFHGGGFVGGSLDTIDTPLRRLANQSRRVVISVGYRLAPENPYPAALDDAMTALEYIAQNYGEFEISPDHIVVMGDSAGGGIAAALAIRASKESEPKIERQVLVYPNTDLTPEWYERWPSVKENDGKLLFADSLKLFFNYYAGDADPYAPTISPVHADDLQGLPPALVITAGHDLLRDEGTAYADNLAASGVETEHWRYAGQIHGFFQFAAVIPEGGQLIDRIATELR